MQAGWIIGVARKSSGRIDAEEYTVAIADMTMALNAVRRLVGRRPETHVWVKEPLREAEPEHEPGAIRRRDGGVPDAACPTLRRASR